MAIINGYISVFQIVVSLISRALVSAISYETLIKFIIIIIQVSTGCAHHVRRVMHQRALDVHLIPEIQEACMDDLGQFCSHSIEKGQVKHCTRKL